MINIYYNNDKRVNVFNQGALTEAYTKDKENKLNVVRQQLEYNPDGTISGAVFNNMYYNYDYNIEGLLKRKSASGKTLLEYTYDKNSNIKSIKDIHLLKWCVSSH